MIHFVFPTGEEIIAPVYPEAVVEGLQNRVLHDLSYSLFFEGRELLPDQPIPEKIMTEPESTIAVVPKNMVSLRQFEARGRSRIGGQDNGCRRVECLSMFPLRNLLDCEVVPQRNLPGREGIPQRGLFDRMYRHGELRPHDGFYDYDSDMTDSYEDDFLGAYYFDEPLDNFPMGIVGRTWHDDVEEEEDISDHPPEQPAIDVANLWSQLTPEETQEVERLREAHGTSDEWTLQLYLASGKKYEDADRLLRQMH